MRERGFTLIELMIVIAIIAIIAAIAIPNLIEARKSHNEAAAIGALRTMVTAQALFRESDKDGDGKLDYANNLPALENANLIDSMLGSGVKQGYNYTLASQDTQSNWEATATPANPNAGQRRFFVDKSGVVRFNKDGPAGPQDTPVGTMGPDFRASVQASSSWNQDQPQQVKVSVWNDGDEMGSSELTFSPPAGMTIDSFDRQDVCFSGSVHCTFTDLAPGVTITLTITVTAMIPGPFALSVRLVAPGDVNPANNDATLMVTVAPAGPDPGVTMNGPATAVLFQPLTFTVNVANHGGQMVSFATLGVGLPSGVSVVSVSPQSHCFVSFGAVICSFAPLDPVVVTITVISSVQGQIVFHASVSTPFDVNPTNNIATLEVTIGSF